MNQPIILTKKEIKAFEAVWLDERLHSEMFISDTARIDFAKVEFFSSAALGVIISHRRNFERIICINVSKFLKGQWECLGLQEMCEFEELTPTTPEA